MWPLLLLLVVAAALLYLAFLHSRVAKDVKELKQAAQSFVTLDEWEEEAQPKIEALQQAQAATGRHVRMLAASVRALEQAQGRSAPVAEADEPPPCEAEDEGGELDAAAADAAHTEGQIQAVLSSMANIFGVAPQPDHEAGFLPAQLFVATRRPFQEQHSRSHPVIEEAEEDEGLFEADYDADDGDATAKA